MPPSPAEPPPAPPVDRFVRRLAVLSLHTSPLAQPGSGDSGGMNVYVRELVSALAQAGVDCTTYVRRWRADLPDEVAVEPGLPGRAHRRRRPDLPKEALPDVVDEFADGVLDHLDGTGGADLVHANYWLSGLAGHRIKHELDLPLVTTFHTLARVKAEGGDPEPRAARAGRGRDHRLHRRHLRELHRGGAPVPPALRRPARAHRDRRARASSTPSSPPATGAAPARPSASATSRCCCSSAASSRSRAPTSPCGPSPPSTGPTPCCVIVGGASGADGEDEVEKLHALVDELGLADRVRFVPPQPHHLLSTYYRAADVVLVPSPLGELRARRPGGGGVRHAGRGRRGRRPAHARRPRPHRLPGDGPRPEVFAAYTDELLANDALAWEMGVSAAARAAGYTWSLAAARLRRLYADLTVGRAGGLRRE